MKTTNIAKILTASLMLVTGQANAAGIWSTINWTDDSSLSFITSTNVTHSGDFNSAASINGHIFEQITIDTSSVSPGFGVFPSPYTGSNFTVVSSAATANTFAFSGSAGVSGTASSDLSSGLIGFDGTVASGASITYTLTGLSANTDYEFYFFNPEWGQTDRTGFLDGSDDVGNTFAVDQSAGSGASIIKYAYNTGASTSFTMTVTSDTQNTSLHNYGFVNIIPEPSTALLGGLGLLALLRRRRA
jgi:hypothetical protein